jgi:hypothetical protein
MLNFETIQEIAATATNTTHNGRVWREINSEDIRDALLGEAVAFLASGDLKPDAKLSQIITNTLAKQADDCDDFGKFLESKILDLFERAKAAHQSDNQDNIRNLEAAAQGLGSFIKRVQSSAGRSSYYRKLEALKREDAGADKMLTSSDYDGFQAVTWQPDQVDDAADEIFESLTQAFGYVLPMCSKFLQSSDFAQFPFSSMKDEKTGKFNDYTDRLSLFSAIDSNRKSYEVDANAALAMIA